MSARRAFHPALRLLDALKIHGPQTTQQLADRLEISPHTARRWLLDLEECELVVVLDRLPQLGHGLGGGARVWDVHASLGQPFYAQRRRGAAAAREGAR
jgi:predicted ArsR family transcriptional regulator